MDAVKDAVNDAGGAAQDRRIEGRGTPEAQWQAWGGLDGLAALALDALVPAGARAIVVAPHPDDEVLGCGGLLALLARAGREVLLLAVTDGEASHPGSRCWSPGALADERSRERRAGLACLGLDAAIQRRRIPDGQVAASQERLLATLAFLCRAGDVLFAPWRFDGHPDHEATGRAAARAAASTGARCIEMPIWMWHWAAPGDPRVPWDALGRLPLDEEAQRRKRQAVAAHVTQLQPQPAAGHDAALPDWALPRMLRPYETFFAEASP